MKKLFILALVCLAFGAFAQSLTIDASTKADPITEATQANGPTGTSWVSALDLTLKVNKILSFTAGGTVTPFAAELKSQLDGRLGVKVAVSVLTITFDLTTADVDIPTGVIKVAFSKTFGAVK